MRRKIVAFFICFFLLGFGCGVVFLLFSLFRFGVKADCFYSAIVCLLLCENGVDAFLL